MTTHNEGRISVYHPTLVFWGVRALLFQGLLVAAAVGLPVLAHLSGAPVRILLPMHWPVILAGLVYGWRGGALTGLLAPSVSFLISGLPLPIILPAMIAELFTYGFVTGLFRERFRWNPFVSVAIALVLGRVAFIFAVVFGSATATNYLEYFKVALLPGLFAGIAQIVLLPFLSSWWARQEQRSSK